MVWIKEWILGIPLMVIGAAILMATGASFNVSLAALSGYLIAWTLFLAFHWCKYG